MTQQRPLAAIMSLVAGPQAAWDMTGHILIGKCQGTQAQSRDTMRHDPENVRVLAQRFFTLIRKNCCQCRQSQTPALIRHVRHNHICFWQKPNPISGALPAALAI